MYSEEVRARMFPPNLASMPSLGVEWQIRSNLLMLKNEKRNGQKAPRGGSSSVYDSCMFPPMK